VPIPVAEAQAGEALLRNAGPDHETSSDWDARVIRDQFAAREERAGLGGYNRSAREALCVRQANFQEVLHF
jgi:hypothetical protein